MIGSTREVPSTGERGSGCAGHRRPNLTISVAAIPPPITPSEPGARDPSRRRWPGRRARDRGDYQGRCRGPAPLLASSFRKPWIRVNEAEAKHRHATPTDLVPERGNTAWPRSPGKVPHAAAPADRPCQGARRLCGAVRVSGAPPRPVPGSPPELRGRSSSASGRSSSSSPPTTTAIPVPPPVEHVGGRLVAPQCRAGPIGHDPRRHARRRGGWAAPTHTRGNHRSSRGRFVPSSAPRCGTRLGGPARRCSFTPHSPAGKSGSSALSVGGLS